MRVSPPEPRAQAPAGEWLLVNGPGCIASGTASGTRVRPALPGLAELPGLHDPAALPALSLPNASGVLAPAIRSLDTRAVVGTRTAALDPLDTDTAAHALVRAEIESFTAHPEPAWIYRAGDTRLSRRLFLLHDHPALVVVIAHVDGPDARVVVAPVFARDAGGDASPLTHTIPGRIRVTSAAGPLTVWHDGAFLPTRAWQAAESVNEAARPVSAAVAGFIEATLAPGGRLHVVIASDDTLLRRLAEAGRLGTPPPRTLRGCVEMIETAEREVAHASRQHSLVAAGATARAAMAARNLRLAEGVEPLADDDAWVPRFARAMEWDARIPGAAPRGSEATRRLRQVRGLITLREIEAARETLLTYGQLVRDGLAPSSLEGGVRYDDAEASLWLVIASELFARRTGEHEFVRHALFPALEEVVERFHGGTRLGIHIGEHGLLMSGEGPAEEARTDLNALWYTAQAAMGQLAKTLGNRQSGAFYVAWAREHQACVIEHLWDEVGGALHGSLAAAGPRGAPAPAHVLAASLSPPLLPAVHAQRLLANIERELLTPAGLRESADSRHALTEWMGPFLSAWVRAHGRSAESQHAAAGWAHRFERTIDACSAGCVPEAFELAEDEADPPRGEGRPISVLATAEMARFWVEELDPEHRMRPRDAET